MFDENSNAVPEPEITPENKTDDLTGNESFAGLDALEAEAGLLDGDEPANQVEQEQSIATEVLLMGAISPLFDIFAPNWKVGKEEKTALCESYAVVIDKYFPDGMSGRFAAELTALTVTGMIIAPRMGQPRQAPEPKKKEVKKEEATIQAKESGAELGAG